MRLRDCKVDRRQPAPTDSQPAQIGLIKRKTLGEVAERSGVLNSGACCVDLVRMGGLLASLNALP